MNKLFLFFIAAALVSCIGKTIEEPCENAPTVITVDRYVYSKDKKNVATVMYVDGIVSFISGKDTGSVEKDGFIRFKLSRDHAYSCSFKWQNDSCIILSGYGKWDVVGHPKKIGIQILKNEEERNLVKNDNDAVVCEGSVTN